MTALPLSAFIFLPYTSRMAALQEDDFNQKSAAFLNWLQGLPGVRVSTKIQIADMRSRVAGRGIVAIEDIEDNEELLSIPCSDLLTVQNSDLPKRIPNAFDGLDHWTSLVLVMIYEAGQGEDSKWWPYLQLLPTEFDTLMYWTPAELAELQGSLVIDKIGKDDANRLFIESLLPVVQDHACLFGRLASAFQCVSAKGALLELAHRMATLIMAYAFDIEYGDDSDEDCLNDSSIIADLPKAMIPLADIFNADGEKMNVNLVQQDDSMSMRASKAITKGQEIFNDYGERPRSDLLRRYGYITDSAKKWDIIELNRTAVIQIAGDHHRLSEDERTERLQSFNDWNDCEDYYELHRQPHGKEFKLDFVLMLLVYTFVMDRDSFRRAKSAGKTPSELRLNLEMALTLKKIIIWHMNTYQTSLTEDAVLLQSSALQRRARMAIEIRLGEKEILAAALDYVENRLAALGQPVALSSHNKELPEQGSATKKRRL